MEKEFVPYELALKLKELGFNENCIMQWHYTNDLIFCVDNWGVPKFKTNVESKSHSSGDCISAPTFSQAFTWFREKYNLHSEIEFRHCKYSFKINFQKLADGESPPVMVWHLTDSWLGLNIDLFNTYEEAELACLIYICAFPTLQQLENVTFKSK